MARAAETEFAPAKVNLALHVTGRREDGYHLLDSLVVFAGVGDRLTVRPADTLTLAVSGPFAADVPADGTNLVLKAARLLAPGRGAAITLDKALPVASGIGGGSADAAAALRALSRLWGVALPAPEAVLTLGADVPVCLRAQAARMRGIGDELAPLPAAAPLHLLLVNPGKPVSTPDIFRRLTSRYNPGLPGPVPCLADTAALVRYVSACRNDLEAPARALLPEIGAVLDAIATAPGCLLARMSGSGATCFGLFADRKTLDRAQRRLRAAHPGWWVAA